MKFIYSLILLLNTTIIFGQLNDYNPVIQTENGKIQGTNESGIRVFKGIPYAAPPIGNFRWKEPQPVQNWTGIRSAKKFGPHAMQLNVYGDMNFQSDSMSEDCLYLNVWTPANSSSDKLPVMVYFHGGGLVTGSGDEPRYAGKTMAKNGIVTITVNYRLGIFGFFSHPALTKESPNHSSGNYGYMDQNAALKWVKENISSFGGDPNRVTIAGESAGSRSVTAQMTTPLSKGLFQQAICSSGSVFGSLTPKKLSIAEQQGVEIAKSLDAKKLSDLRKIPADELLHKGKVKTFGTIDGYFFTDEPAKILEKKKENDVPLLIGWNSMELPMQWFLANKKPTIDNLKATLTTLFSDEQVNQILEKYHLKTDDDVINEGYKLSRDIFIAYNTWKWCTMHAKNTDHPVYRYLYCHARPGIKQKNMESGLAGGVKKADSKEETYPQPKVKGPVHSADIEYAMGNLSTNEIYDWNADDYEVSTIFLRYYANFVKTGNPNGLGLINWPAYNKNDNSPVLYLDLETKVKNADPETEDRYEFLDNLYFPNLDK